MGAWKGDVEQFLIANEGKASRERLTLIRIYEEIRALGYDGSYDTVRRYAKAWARKRGAVTGSYEQASYAIQDTPDVVQQHYGRFLPQDKAALAAKILNQVWEAA
jgi:hypothetical protein